MSEQSVTETAILRVDPQRCTWRSLGDDVIVLDLVGSAYFELNHTGAVLWPHLVEGAGEAALVELLRQAQAQDPTGGTFDPVGDVRAFVAQLRGAGLLQTGPGT